MEMDGTRCLYQSRQFMRYVRKVRCDGTSSAELRVQVIMAEK